MSKGNARLSPTQVKNIRKALAQGATVASLARKYRRHAHTIRNIKFGRTWPGVGGAA